MKNRQQIDLEAIARQAMIEHGLDPDFSDAALKQLATIGTPATADDADVEDLRHLLWCSIDNEESRDLDQLSVAEEEDGTIRLYVAIADVDVLVAKGTPIDAGAARNTTSVYTAARVFSMLPEKLSTDFTSMNEGEDRLAVVTEIVVGRDGSLGASKISRAIVRNHAKLVYEEVGAWLTGEAEAPVKVKAMPELERRLRLQESIAQVLRKFRDEEGALDLETIQPKVVVSDDEVVDVRQTRKNRAHEIIEDFMIAVNRVSALFLRDRNFPAIRRILRRPERWDRIVAIAGEYGWDLPSHPDAASLEQFLAARKEADPVRFPDLSLSVVKMLGSGEYEVELPGDEPTGHFGLAVRDYLHSTAPNRRYPDLITQRLLKAAIAGRPSPYSVDELEQLARHCTVQEDQAEKVERQVRKSAAALFLSSKIGQRFEAIVTGQSKKGTWVRALETPVEGKLIRGFLRLDVGDRLRVKLHSVDVERGFIDFVRAD